MILRLTAFILIGISVFSCSSEEIDNSWAVDRDALIGTWTGDVNFIITNLKTNEETKGIKSVRIKFFNKEDALVSTDFFLNSECTWAYQPEPETIVLTPLGYSNQFPQTMKVINKSQNKQTWRGVYKDFEYDQTTMMSTEYKVEETWVLTKQ